LGYTTPMSGLLIGFNMKDFNKILHQSSVASVSGLSILGWLFCFLWHLFKIRGPLGYSNTVCVQSSLFKKILFLYVKHCPAVVATLHIPSIHNKIQKFWRYVTMRDIDHEHQK